MNKRLSIVLIGIMVAGGFLWLRMKTNLSTQEMSTKISLLRTEDLETKTDHYFSQTHEVSTSEKYTSIENPVVKGVERKIADMAQEELDEAIDIGRARVQNDKLIYRLNHGELTIEDVKKAKVFLDRLAELSAERANRMVTELAPEFESALKKIDGELQVIRKILKSDLKFLDTNSQPTEIRKTTL